MLLLTHSVERWKNKERKGKCKYLKGSGGEFNSDSRFGLQAKLISSKPGKDVGFSHTRVPDQNDLEQIIILVVHPMRHRSSPLRSLKLNLPDPIPNNTYTYSIQIQIQAIKKKETRTERRNRSNNRIRKQKTYREKV